MMIFHRRMDEDVHASKQVHLTGISLNPTIHPRYTPSAYAHHDTRFEYLQSTRMLCKDRVQRSNAVAILSLPEDENKHDRVEHASYLVVVCKSCTQCAICDSLAQAELLGVLMISLND